MIFVTKIIVYCKALVLLWMIIQVKLVLQKLVRVYLIIGLKLIHLQDCSKICVMKLGVILCMLLLLVVII